MRREALERLLGRCQEHGLPVLLVHAPGSRAHRRFLTPAIDADFRAYVAGLCRRHGVSFVDARDWVPDPFFYDCLHMEERGAVHFSRLLTHRALRQRRADVLHEGQATVDRGGRTSAPTGATRP
jgi:hypothetical protein